METPLNSAESMLFSSRYGKRIIVIHMLSHKTTVNQVQEIEILQNLSYGYNGIAFEINNNKSSRKTQIFMLNDELQNLKCQ